MLCYRNYFNGAYHNFPFATFNCATYTPKQGSLYYVYQALKATVPLCSFAPNQVIPAGWVLLFDYVVNYDDVNDNIYDYLSLFENVGSVSATATLSDSNVNTTCTAPTCTMSPPSCTSTGTGVTATPTAYGTYTSGWNLSLTGENSAADVNVYCKLVN
jgi:hypothetical protein